MTNSELPNSRGHHLTRREEIELGRPIAAKRAHDMPGPPLPERRFAALAEAASSARERLVVCNFDLIQWVLTKKFAKAADYQRDDLFQAGCEGLCRAADHFNPEMEARFGTYAVHWIMSYCRMHLHRSTLPLTVGLGHLGRALIHKGDAIYAMHSAGYSNARIAEEVKVKDYEVEELLVLITAKLVPLDCPIQSTTGGQPWSYADVTPDDKVPIDEDVMERLDQDTTVKIFNQQVARLDARDRRVVEARLRGCSLAEVGAVIGVSRERVRQIENAALDCVKRGCRRAIKGGARPARAL